MVKLQAASELFWKLGDQIKLVIGIDVEKDCPESRNIIIVFYSKRKILICNSCLILKQKLVSTVTNILKLIYNF